MLHTMVDLSVFLYNGNKFLKDHYLNIHNNLNNFFHTVIKQYYKNSNKGGDIHGVNETVSLTFFETMDKNGNRILASYTPYGKIVFINESQKNYFDLIQNSGVIIPGFKLNHYHNYAIATLQKYNDIFIIPDRLYYIECFNNNKLHAVKQLRSITPVPLNLKNSKNYTDEYFELFQIHTLNVELVLGNLNYLFNSNTIAVNNVTTYPQSTSNPTTDIVDTLNKEIDRLRKRYNDKDNYATSLSKELTLVCDTKRILLQELRDTTISKEKLEKELEEAYEKVASLMDQYQYFKNNNNNNTSTNIWDILECKPDDPKEVIESAIKKAILSYHPDKVAIAGPLLQKYANDLTIEILNFKKVFDIQKKAINKVKTDADTYY